MKASLLLLLLSACAGESVARVEANPARRTWEQQLKTLDAKAPLEVRFNPTPCNCPAFEVRVAERWLRAELQGDADKLLPWLTFLATTPQETLPLPVTLKGRLERDLVRTAQGDYAVRIDVAEIIAPQVPPEPPQPEPPPTP